MSLFCSNFNPANRPDAPWFKRKTAESIDSKNDRIWVGMKCGQGRNRTADTEIFSLLLYRLSYLAR
jgi:hypothetical protein